MKHHSTTARRLQNADGDEVASFEIKNGVLSNDQDKPTFSNVTVASGKLQLTFSENIAANTNIDKADFSVNVAGATAASIASGKVELTLSAAVTAGQAVTVAYTKSSTTNQNIADAAGNAVATFAAQNL